MTMFCMKNVEYVFMFVYLVSYTGAVSELFNLSIVQKNMPVCHALLRCNNVCGVEMT